jgi:hypothetical protein
MSICTPGDGSNIGNTSQIIKIPGVAGPDGPGTDHELILKKGICAESEPYIIDTAAGEYVKFSAKETQDAVTMYLDNVDVAVIDGATGTVRLTITGPDLPYAGIWWSAFTIYDINDVVKHEIPAWLYVEKGIHHKIRQNTPLSISEVRLFLMDKCPEDNYLLDDVEFTDTEYMAAIRWPIDKWNETPPDVQRYTQTTCPWRYHWMVGAASMLLKMAAHNYARNSLDYAAGGITVRDKSKAQEYVALAKDLQAEFISWMEAKKVEINIDLCYGGILSWEFYGSRYL